jgi:hypothetical protein
MVSIVWVLVTQVERLRRARTLGFVFIANVFLHLVLDSYVGHIYWLWPFSGKSFALLSVQRHHDFWVLNYLLHPTFALELAIVAVATMVWLRSAKNATQRP